MLVVVLALDIVMSMMLMLVFSCVPLLLMLLLLLCRCNCSQCTQQYALQNGRKTRKPIFKKRLKKTLYWKCVKLQIKQRLEIVIFICKAIKTWWWYSNCAHTNKKTTDIDTFRHSIHNWFCVLWERRALSNFSDWIPFNFIANRKVQTFLTILID